MGKQRKKKTRRDAAEITRSVVEQATDEPITLSEAGEPEEQEGDTRNPAAVALTKLGASKGGKARAKKLREKRRSEIARKAAESRWKKTDSG